MLILVSCYCCSRLAGGPPGRQSPAHPVVEIVLGHAAAVVGDGDEALGSGGVGAGDDEGDGDAAGARAVVPRRAQRVVDELRHRVHKGVPPLRRKVLVVAGHGERLGVGLEADPLPRRRRQRAVLGRGDHHQRGAIAQRSGVRVRDAVALCVGQHKALQRIEKRPSQAAGGCAAGSGRRAVAAHPRQRGPEVRGHLLVQLLQAGYRQRDERIAAGGLLVSRKGHADRLSCHPAVSSTSWP